MGFQACVRLKDCRHISTQCQCSLNTKILIELFACIAPGERSDRRAWGPYQIYRCGLSLFGCVICPHSRDQYMESIPVMKQLIINSKPRTLRFQLMVSKALQKSLNRIAVGEIPTPERNRIVVGSTCHDLTILHSPTFGRNTAFHRRASCWRPIGCIAILPSTPNRTEQHQIHLTNSCAVSREPALDLC